VPERLGRYRILRELGRGAMGAVYLAQDSQLDRTVALKAPRFTGADGPEIRQRFLSEARAAASIEHPNICPIYDVGEIDGTPYLTMAYVQGRTLAQLLEDRTPWPQRQAASLVRELTKPLQAAHDRGVVHRDLKPSHIMINKRGEGRMELITIGRDVGRDIAAQGFAWIPRAAWSIRPHLQPHWRRLGEDWDRLEPDLHLAGGARFRFPRYGRFHWSPAAAALFGAAVGRLFTSREFLIGTRSMSAKIRLRPPRLAEVL
jgi:serine/threonine protein kinase